MALFAVTYVYAPELALQRDDNRPAHRAWLAEQVDRGRVLSAGPFPDGGGALLVVAGDSEDEVRAALGGDPHQRRGLVAEVHVRAWTPVLGAFTAG